MDNNQTDLWKMHKSRKIIIETLILLIEESGYRIHYRQDNQYRDLITVYASHRYMDIIIEEITNLTLKVCVWHKSSETAERKLDLSNPKSVDELLEFFKINKFLLFSHTLKIPTLP